MVKVKACEHTGIIQYVHSAHVSNKITIS